MFIEFIITNLSIQIEEKRQQQKMDINLFKIGKKKKKKKWNEIF
jgi:hypothetical protein